MKRDIGIELFRILMMLGVCCCHVIYVANSSARMFGANEFLSGLASSAVDGFVFISGYYGIRFSFTKAIKLYSLGLFYGLVGGVPMSNGGGYVMRSQASVVATGSCMPMLP